MKKLICTLFVLLMVGCGGGHNWTEEDEATFIYYCMLPPSPGRDFCECAMNELQHIYPEPEDVENLTAEQVYVISVDCTE